MLLCDLVNKSLSVKQDQLENQLAEIDKLSSEIKEKTQEIYRNITQEYNSYFSSLVEQEGKKIALIQFNYNDLLKDLNSINDLISYNNKIENSKTPDYQDFLLKYKEISKTIEGLLNRRNKEYSELEVEADDFYNVLDEINHKLNKYEKLNEILKIKDDVIWSLINENKNNVMSDKFLEKKVEYEEEIEGWARLSYNYLTELKNLTKYVLIVV